MGNHILRKETYGTCFSRSTDAVAINKESYQRKRSREQLGSSHDPGHLKYTTKQRRNVNHPREFHQALHAWSDQSQHTKFKGRVKTMSVGFAI